MGQSSSKTTRSRSQNEQENQTRRKRGRYSAKHIRLTDRDFSIFRMIGSRGCVTLGAIHRNFWKDSKSEACKDRIEQLSRGGYLKRETTDVRGRHEVFYYLAKKALSEFSEDEKKGFYRKRPSNTEVKHVLDMGDVLDSFASKEVASKNEHQLKSEKVLNGGTRNFEVPDREVTLENEAGRRFTFFIEIDGAYHGSRLKQKVEALQKAEKPVIWVVKSQGRLNTLNYATREHSNITPILLSDLHKI